MPEELTIEQPEVAQEQFQQEPPDKTRALYDKLYKTQLYTKSYDDFKKQYSTPDSIGKLYQGLSDNQLYTKSQDDFIGQYFDSAKGSGLAGAVGSKIISTPDFKPQPVSGAREFSFEKTPDEIEAGKLEGKARNAQSRITDKLHGNDTQYENLIREDRANSYTMEQMKSDYKKLGQIIPIGKEDQWLQREKKRQYDLPVSPQDISDAKSGVILNEHGTRNFINKTGDKQLQADAYLVDAHNSIANDPNGAKRIQKVLKNKDKIEKGHIQYDASTGTLTKPESFLNSLVTAWSEKDKLFSNYDYYTDNDKPAVITKLENDMRRHDPDEPIPVPEGFGGKAGALLGGNPVSGLVAGGIAATGATLAGAPEAAPLAAQLSSGAISAVDYYKMGYASALENGYRQFRQQGFDENESYKKAQELANSQAAIDAVSAGAMGALSFGRAFNPSGSVTDAFKKSVFKGLTQLGETGTKKALEGMGIGAIGATGQILKNIQAQQAGINTDTYEGAGQQFSTGIWFTLGAAMLAKGSKTLTGPAKQELRQGLSKMPEEQLNQEMNNLVQAGQITEHEAKLTIQDIQEHKAIDQLIPDDIPEINRLKIQAKIRERNILDEKIKNTDKAFHEDLKERVKKLNEDILTLASEKEEKSDNAKLIEKNLDKIPEVYQETAKRDPDGFLQFIADQSFGRDENGTVMEGQSAEPEMRKNFGDKLVDKAKELYPLTQNIEENASNVRENQRELPSRGEILGNGQEVRGNDVQQVQEQPSVSPGATEQAGGGEAQNQIAGEKVGQPPLTGITHAQMDETAREFGLETYEKAPEKVAEWDEAAAKRIEQPGELDKLFEKLRNGQAPDAVETRMMLMYMADLKAKIIENPSAENLNQLKRTKDLFNIAGRIQGQQLRARQGERPVEESLPDYYIREMEASGVGELTEQQKTTAQKEHAEISKANEELQAKLKIAEEENAKLKAEAEIKKAKSAKKPGEKRDYKTERKDIVEHMREQLKKARGETSVAFVPYAKELIAIAPDVAKLVRNLVEEGIEKLPEVVKAVHDQIKDLIPGVTEKDVHNIIAGEYNQRKETRNETLAKLQDLRTQAKLINRLEELENGIEPKDEKKKIRRNREIEELRQKIKEHDLTKLSDYKKHTRKQIDELEEKLKIGDFAPEEKNPEIELDDEALKLKNRLIELKQEREKRLAKLEYENKSKAEKAVDALTNVLGVPRTIMASVDFSAPLRQGFVATVSHPSKALPAFAEMFKQAFSQKRFDRWIYDLKQSHAYQIMEKSGLYVADPNNLHLSAKEETWMNNLAEKIPIIGKAIKGSERAYVAYLNKMRVDIFNQGIERLMTEGKTPENSPEIYEALASFINNSTGRGELGKLEPAAQLLNTAFFSPRLIASRVNLLNPLYYTKLPKEVRIMALKDMAKTIGFGLSIIALSKLAGADVEDDPRSPDFGKVRFGNTRYDIWGGFQQYVRVISQLVAGSTKSSTTGKINDLTKDNARKTRADVVGAFFRGKLSPVPGTIWDFAANKTVTGEKPTIENKAVDLFMPMIANDITDAWKDQGFKSIFTVGVPSSLGVGISTYGGKKK